MPPHISNIDSIDALKSHVDRITVQRLWAAVSRYNLSVRLVYIERLSAITLLDEVRDHLGPDVPVEAEHHLEQLRAGLLRCDTCAFNADVSAASLSDFQQPDDTHRD